MKYDLDRTGIKMGITPDALPRSATLVLFWTAGVTTASICSVTTATCS